MNKETKEEIKKEILEEIFTQKDIFLFLRDIIIIFIVIFLWFFKFVLWPSEIIWHSMNDNFYENEFILVNRFSYLDLPFFWRLKEYKRWDVIVCDPEVEKERKYLIKRIIGLPWEKIKIKNWKVYIKQKNKKDFYELKEDYLNWVNKWNTFVWTDNNDKEFIFNIPKDSYFIMWDNRLHSSDSRTCFRKNCKLYNKHFVKKDEILWKVFLDLWYFDFNTLSFVDPETWKKTYPKFFNFLNDYNYKK